MNNHLFKRFLSVALALLMVLSCVPTRAFAAETGSGDIVINNPGASKDDEYVVNATGTGTEADPIVMTTAGDYTGTAPSTGTDKYCYFTYKATKAGSISVYCEGVDWRAYTWVNDVAIMHDGSDMCNPKYLDTPSTIIQELAAGDEFVIKITPYISYKYGGEITITFDPGTTAGEGGGSTEPEVTYVAKIGETGYETFAEALTAANAMTGDVEVEIYDKVTLNSNLSGSFDSIKFVGKDTDAEIYLDVQGYITATGKKVAFEGLKLSKSEGGFITNAGFMNVAFGIYDVTEVTYTSCTFANGAYAASGKVTYTDCTFQKSWEKYGLWAYGDVDVTVNGGAFDNDRGIKMYAEGAAKTTDLTVKGVDFSKLTGKPAIVLTYGESVTLEGNTYSDTGVFELDLDGAPNGTSVTSTDAITCVNDNGECGVLVDGKIYTTVAQAVEAAEEGSKVTLLYSTDEAAEFPENTTVTVADGVSAPNVTVATPTPVPTYVAEVNGVQYETLEEAFANAAAGDTIKLLTDAAPVLNSQRAITKAAVIDLNGFTLTLAEDDLYFGTTTFTNGKIVVDPSVKASTAVFWMFENQTLVFDGVEIVATGVTGTYLIGINGGANSAVKLLNGSKITIANTDKAGLTAVICDNGSGNSVVIEDAVIDVANVDGRFYLGGASGSITVKDSDIDLNGVKEGFYLRANQTLAIEGNSTVDITLNDTNGRYGINVTDLTASYTVADTAEVNATVYTPPAPVYVAYIGTQGYETLQAAIDAVQNGETITLQTDCDETITFTQTKDISFVLDGNNKTMTGSINITARAGKDAESTLVIKNFNFITDKTTYDFIKSVETNYYPNNITIQGCSFTGTGDINAAGYAVVAVRLKSANNILIKDCTGSGLHSFLQNTAGWDLTVDNVYITNSLSGFAMGTVQGVTVKNCDIEATNFGIRLDAQYDNKAVIADNNITAFIPVVVRKATVAGTITFNGTNTMTETNTDGLWLAIGTNEYAENGIMPTDPTGKITVTLNDKGLDAKGVYGNYVEKPTGTLTNCYTSGTGYWGECGGNAKESFVFKFYNGDTYMGSTSLNNVGGIIDGEVYVSWSILLDAESNTDPYWTMEWTVQPTLAMQPTRCEQWVDGVKVAEAAVEPNWSDRIFPVVAAVTDENGKILSYVNGTDGYTLADAVAKGGNITLLADVTVSKTLTVPAGVTVTLDLNGKTLNGYFAPFKGNLTVKNGSIVNTNSSYSAIEINAGELVLKNVNIDSARHAVRIDGPVTATIDGGTYRAAIGNGTGTYNTINVGGTGNEKLTIVSGTFIGPKGTVADSGAAVNVKTGATVTIEGGNFSGGKNNTLAADGTLTVTGGTFDQDPSAYVADGYVAVKENGVWIVVPPIKVTYADGTVEYFSDMLEAVPNKANYPKLEGATIKLLQDVSGKGLKIMENGITIDLNGYTYTITEATGSPGTETSGFQIRPEITTSVTIKNGTIKVAEGVRVVWMFNCYASDFIVENVTVDCTNMDWSYGESCYVVVSRSGDNVQFTGNTEVVNFKSEVAGNAINVGGTMTIGENVVVDGTIELGAGTTLTAPAGLNVVTVDGYKVVYENGVYKSIAKVYVAKIGEVGYETFEEALNAVENGQTITLLNVESTAEQSKEIDFTKNISFTITGTAPNYALPVITFQNATVTIKDAEILTAELDARQNATINVVNSIVHGAGSDSIIKSYYNGAINISGNSVVHTMQMTTMGYITISGGAKVNATWQTNVYGNGMIVIENGAVLATGGLNLIGKDYSDRDNTDADRVGKPATIIVDNATLKAGEVYSESGADYSYNADGYGINVGTIAGKAALLDIKNGATVSLRMGSGNTVNFGADAAVNVADSTLKVIARGEGTVKLNNSTTILVSGTSDIAANVTGSGWVYMNGVSLNADTKLHGAKVAFINGTNSIAGSVIDGGWFSVGVGQDASAEAAAEFAAANGITLGDVTVNVSGDAIIGSGSDAAYSGWIGSAYSADKTQYKYVLNIEDSLATFGYLHISKDGELNVKGHATNKYTYDNANVDFYAGDFIVNGVATFDGIDAWVRTTKISVDHVDGVVNIVGGTNYEASRHVGANTGDALVFYKAGAFNVDAASKVEIDNAITMIDGAKLNLGGKIIANGAVTGNGTITLTDVNATFEAPEGLTVATNVADYDVAYVDGVYKLVAKVYVAKIGTQGFETLAEAFAAIGAGDVVIELLADATMDYNPGEAFGTAETTSLTINGNDHVLTLNQKNNQWSSLGLANADAKLVLNNMTVEKTGYGDTSGAWDTHAINISSYVEMNSVTVNNAIAVEDGATLNDVIINEANGYYGLWISGNGQSVIVNGGEINATNGGRGIKIADEYVGTPASVALNVTDTKFNTAKKAAVQVSSTAGAKITASNVDITNVAEDSVNFAWVDEDRAANFGNVEVTGATVSQEAVENFNIVVKDGDKIVSYFKTLDDLFDNVSAYAKVSNVTVELMGDVVATKVVKTNSLKTYNFVTNVAGGVTMDLQYADSWNYFRKVNIGEGVTVEAEYLVFSTESTIAGTVDCYYPYINGGKVTVAKTGVLKYEGGDALQVKGNGAVLTVNGTVIAPTINVWVGNAQLIVSGENAKIEANWIDIWDGAPSVKIENGATIETKAIKVSRGGEITVTDATLTAETIEVGHNGNSAGVLTESGNSTINGEIKMTATGSVVNSDGGLNVTTNLADHKVVFENGQYKVVPMVYVAQVGEQKFESLAEAIEAAQAGETVKLVSNASGDGIVIDKSISIDLAGFTYTFNGTLAGSAGTKSCGFQILKGNTVKIMNGALVMDEAAVRGHDGKVGNNFVIQNYADLTLTGVAISGNSKTSYVVSINSGNVAMNGNTSITAPAGAVAFDVYDYSAGGYAVPVVTVNTTGTITGKIEVSEAASLAISGGIFTEPIAEAWCAEGYVPVKNADGTYGVKVGSFVVRNTTTGVGYESLAEALTDAQNGETITLIWSEGDAPIAMNGAVFGKTVTITGTATVDWSKGFLFVGRGGEGNGTVIFDNANLTSASDSASTGIHVSGREKDTTNKYDGTLIIKNSTIVLDYLINKGTMTLDNSTLTVKNGFSIGGRPASETESGVDATAILNLTNGSKVIVNNHNGMGLGYEAIGVMNIDKTSSFETTQSFLVTAKGTMNIAGTAKIAGTLTNNGSIVLTDAAAILTSSECGNVTTNVKDYKVAYENGAYKLVAKVYVAKIGTQGFETLAEAIAAAQAGETITFVADITEDVTVGKSLTIDGANFKFTGNISVSGNTSEVTVKNVNFVDGTGYAITTNRIKSITVENCTVTNYVWGFLYANKSTPTVVVKDVKVDGGSYGMHWVYGTSATLENVTMTNVTNGLLIQNYASKTINLKNCSISSIEIWERDGSSGVQTFVFEGLNEISNMTTSQYAVLKGAAINGTNFYGDLAPIVAKAENGQTVTVLSDIDLVWDGETAVDGIPCLLIVKDKSMTLDLNGKAITADMSGMTGEYNVGIAVIGTGELTVNAANGGSITASGIKAYSLFSAYDSTAKLTINGGAYELAEAMDCLIHSAGDETVTINGGTFTLGNLGTGTNGQPWIFNANGGNLRNVIVNGGTFNADVNHQFWANEVYVPETLALKDNGDGTWTVVPAVAYVTERANSSDSFDRKVGYATLQEAVDANSVDNVVILLADGESATANKEMTITKNGFTAAITAGEGLMMKETAEAYIVCKPVAQIGDTKYATLEDVLMAAQDGDTVVLLADIDYTTHMGVVSILKNYTIDLNGHTLKANGAAIFADQGAIVDTGATKGLLAVPEGFLLMHNTDVQTMLPVWNEEGTGYVFVKVMPQSKPIAAGDNSFTIELRPSISGGGVTTSAVFSDGAADNGITISILVNCKDANGNIVETVRFVVSDELLKSVYTAQTSIKVSITGATTEIAAAYEVVLVVTSEAGAAFEAVLGSYEPTSDNP